MDNNNLNDHLDDRYLGPPPTPQESWKEIVNHLYSDIAGLYESQSLLIRKEISEKVDTVKTAATSFAIGGGLLFMALLAVTAALVFGLADLFDIPVWGSAFIVSGLFSAIGIVMILGAKKKLAADQLVPRQSLETLGEVKNTFKERINEFKHH